MTQTTKRTVDKYLVTFSRLGDRGAQEQLVTRYQKKFLGHAYRLLGIPSRQGTLYRTDG